MTFQNSNHRILFLTLIALAGTAVLLSRLHSYQIKQNEAFIEKLPKNHEVIIREPGIRGNITDRNGVILAKNKRNYEISFNLREVHQAYLADVKNNTTSAPSNLSTINDIVNLYLRPLLQAKTKHISKHQTKAINLDRPEKNIPGINAHYNTHGGLIPFTFRDDLSYDEFAYAAENNIFLPGVYISVRPQRTYPLGSLASHILGYVKPWAKGDVPVGFKHYIGDERGVNGVELTLDKELRGTEGIQRILRNPKGKTLSLIDRTRSGSGAQVTLTIDAELQYLTERVLRIAGRAAAVVMDPNTGEILAMASTPDYNPNHFIPKLDKNQNSLYKKNKARPFNNAAIQNFTPGSTFKLPTAVIACLHNQSNFSHFCKGYIQYGKIKCNCWLTSGHKRLELPAALQRSCNPYFMQLAAVIGQKKLVEGMTKLGFGVKTGIRLPTESAGILPGNAIWRRKNRNKILTPAISGMTTIGQADSECSPLQMVTLVSAIANNGKLYQPRIIKQTNHPIKRQSIADKPKIKLDLIKEGVPLKGMQKIRKGMWLAVNKAGGTAKFVKLPSFKEIEVAAKTGTAQTTDWGMKTNVAWTVGFAPYDKPKYAVAVAVRRGTSGGSVAGPLMRLILEGAFSKDQGLYKIPLKPLNPPQGNFDLIGKIIVPEKNALEALFSSKILRENVQKQKNEEQNSNEQKPKNQTEQKKISAEEKKYYIRVLPPKKKKT